MADHVGDEGEDDEVLAHFLESQILSGPPEPDQEAAKRQRLDGEGSHQRSRAQIDTSLFSKIPPELFHHILKFLSSEDLISCSLVCRFMNLAASDESLWRRLYCMRWGLTSSTGKLRACAWKKLYIQRDQEDMVEFVRNTPSEFKEYYIQMQAAKRSQAPLPTQLIELIVDYRLRLWRSTF